MLPELRESTEKRIQEIEKTIYRYQGIIYYIDDHVIEDIDIVLHGRYVDSDETSTLQFKAFNYEMIGLVQNTIARLKESLQSWQEELQKEA